MDKKFDALLEVYETMDQDAKDAVDMMTKGCEIGMLATGALIGIALVAIDNLVWKVRQAKKSKKTEQK